MSIRCPVCRGQKRVCKLGGFTDDCDNCKGVGYIENEAVNEVAEDVKTEVVQMPMIEGKVARKASKAVKKVKKKK